MHRHDDRGFTISKLHVTTSLTDFDEARDDECLDHISTADDRERRVQADSWNVVTVG